MPNFQNVNLITPNGTFLTACHGGGVGFKTGNGIVTNVSTAPGPNETFQLVPQNGGSGQFALITANGNPVTVVNGGGIGNANPSFPMRDPGNGQLPSSTNPGDTYPLHTDATSPGPWEQFTLNLNSSTNPWQVRIQAPNGNFLSAWQGGGIGDNAANNTPIHTDGQPGQIISWDVWTMNQPWLYNWVRFDFYTTNDDLSGGTTGRGPSWLQAAFALADGTSMMLTAVNLNNQGQRIPFPNNTQNTCFVQLPRPVTSDYITQMTLTLMQPPNSFPAGTDEWHYSNIDLYLAKNGPRPANVINPPANSYFPLIKVGLWNPPGVNPNTVLSKANPSVVYNIPDIQVHSSGSDAPGVGAVVTNN